MKRSVYVLHIIYLGIGITPSQTTAPFEMLKVRNLSTFWPDAQSYLTNFYDNLIPSTSAHHASMLQDIQNGRRTEIESLNGAVVKLAYESGVAVPLNEIIVTMVKAKEHFNYH